MSFDVLRREVDINQNLLCEASAGTGKTFTIEHLYIRRLLAAPQRKVRDIAVLTFTKAVAGELTLRLKRALDKAIDDLRTKNPNGADYLLAIIEQDKHLEAANILEEAREEMECAAIDTIHGFCHRVLSDYYVRGRDSFATNSDYTFLIEEFFRTQVPATHEELKVLLAHYKRNFADLAEDLAKHLWDDGPPCRSVAELTKLLQKASCSVANPFEALIEASHHYNRLRSRDGVLKIEVEQAFEAISRLDDIARIIEHPLYASSVFKERKAKSSGVDLPIVAFAMELEPLIHELAHPDSIFERLKSRCRAFIRSELEKRGKYAFQELLIRMCQELENRAFLHYMQKRFSCLIVDEFQDTDERQWNIIQKLSSGNWEGLLYFVGDPKQSIYSFRQADVYSYMQAKNLKNQAVVTLSNNFRSSPDLVTALNTLFVGPHTHKLFPMPKLGISLDVPAISCKSSVENLQDGLGAVHFFIDRDDEHFAYIAKELVRLKKIGVELSQMAILVKDRYQSERITAYLEALNIPVNSWRKKSIIDSPAHLFLQRLAASIASIRDRSRLIDLVMQPPFNYSSSSCLKLREDLTFWADHVATLLALRKSFEASSLAGLVHTFLHAVWPGTSCVMKETLWSDKTFLSDLDALLEVVPATIQSPEALQEFLYTLTRYPQHEKEELQSRSDPELEAVHVLTMHLSKGLEFDVVFALGLAAESPCETKENEAELLRLFYVACTRAKRRLYLPVIKSAESAMELYLQAVDIDWLIARSQGTITKCELDGVVAERQADLELQRSPLIFTPLPYSPYCYTLSSYSLRKQTAPTLKSKEDLSLPTGPEGGLLLHELLDERVQEDVEILKARLEATIYEGFEEEVALLLKRARSVNLGSFRLSDVNPDRMRSEARFVYQEQENVFMQGYIDLLFEHNGLYYLLDWKSNALESYSEEALQKEVALQKYDLQAKIYTTALRKCTPNFGGFYFVFLRGLDDTSTSGVLHYG